MLLLGLRWVRHKFNEVITDPSCEFMLTVSSQSHGLNTVNSLQSFSQACLPIKLSLPGWQRAPQDRGMAVEFWRPLGPLRPSSLAFLQSANCKGDESSSKQQIPSVGNGGHRLL